jgi:hypothetical protein
MLVLIKRKVMYFCHEYKMTALNCPLLTLLQVDNEESLMEKAPNWNEATATESEADVSEKTSR